MFDSVTVSIGLEISGMLIRMPLVAWVVSETSVAPKSMKPGRMM